MRNNLAWLLSILVTAAQAAVLKPAPIPDTPKPVTLKIRISSQKSSNATKAYTPISPSPAPIPEYKAECCFGEDP